MLLKIEQTPIEFTIANNLFLTDTNLYKSYLNYKNSYVNGDLPPNYSNL